MAAAAVVVVVDRRGEDRKRKGGKEGISLMFLAADQLRSQGYPGFANSHGKGGVLRAEGVGGRGGLEVEERRGRRCPYFSRREVNALGESNPQAPLSDKVGLGPGRRGTRAPGPPRASAQTALPTARLAHREDLEI